MWMHKENGKDYNEARAAVAVSDTIDGNYTWLGSFRPPSGTSPVRGPRWRTRARPASVLQYRCGSGTNASDVLRRMPLNERPHQDANRAQCSLIARKTHVR